MLLARVTPLRIRHDQAVRHILNVWYHISARLAGAGGTDNQIVVVQTGLSRVIGYHSILCKYSFAICSRIFHILFSFLFLISKPEAICISRYLIQHYFPMMPVASPKSTASFAL